MSEDKGEIMEQHEIRVVPYKKADIVHIGGSIHFKYLGFWYSGTEGYGNASASLTHVATCPACANPDGTFGRARGLTEMEWEALADLFFTARNDDALDRQQRGRELSSASQVWHNALFNAPVEGEVKVVGL